MDNKGEAAEIAARVKRLPGWKVSTPRSLSGAYKVTAPIGTVVTEIHMSPSDKNWKRVVMRALNNAGFADDEAKYEAARAQERAALLEQQRRAAEKKAMEIANNSKMLNKARGPYALPEEVDYSWFAEKHPAPWHRWVLMTPDLAKRIMAELNTDNFRKLRPKQVEHYRNVILSAQWHLTHQGMAIDTRGVLQDGQHRLQAIIDAQVTVPVSFYVGMPEENSKALDEGLLRRAADLVANGEGYAALTAAVVKVVDAYDSADPRRTYHTKQTNESVWDLLKLDEVNIREAARWGSAHYKKPKLNATGLAAAYYLLRKSNGADNAYIVAFFNGLTTGCKGNTRTMLDEDDPRTKLRELMANFRDRGKRVNALDQLGLIIICWNFIAENHVPKFLRLADNQEMPGIMKCAPTGRWASATPMALTGEVAHAEAQLAELAAEAA